MVDSTTMMDLVENSVKLEKLSISLIESNKELIKRLDNLISLFEEAAKNVSSGSHEEIVQLNSKINALIQDNKQLARGLVLMEERLKGQQGMGIPARPLPKL